MLQQVQELRAAFAAQMPPPDTSLRTYDATADGVPVRVYIPPDAEGKKLPVGIFYHGGGYLFGDLDSEDALCRDFARNISCIIVSIDYRRSNAHKFPVMLVDSLAAYKWVSFYSTSRATEG